VGIALSDPTGILASPLTIIERSRDGSDYEAILKIARSNGVVHIIVGLPLSMDGSIGNQAEKTAHFAENLKQRTTIPVSYQDERLSTVEARRMVREARKPAKTERYDAAAAALILQDYLNTAHPIEFPNDPEEQATA
jgi:putative holliday junction resolvase